MEYVYMILGRDLKSLLSFGRKRTLKSSLAFYAGVVLGLALAGGIGYGTFRLFVYVRTTLATMPQLVSAIEINVLNGVSLFMLMMVFTTGIQTTYKTIYESDDLGFLMAQPVPVQAIFLSKFISSYVSQAIVALVFGLPAWLGYALATRAGLGFYLIAFAGLALLLLVAHSLVTFLLLVAMRYLPGRKMKQLFIASTAILGVLMALLPQMVSSQLSRAGDPSKMLEIIGRGQLARTWYLPSTWMVNSVLGTAKGYGLNPLSYGLVLVVGALGLSALSVRVSRGWFLAGWSGRTEETGASAKRRNMTGRRAAFSSRRLPSGTFWTVLRKDMRLLFRDPLIWYNLVIGVIVVGFFIFNRLSQPVRFPGEDALAMGLAVLMGAIAGAQTGGISISKEGSSFWLMRGNPVEARGLFAAKTVYALLPPTILLALSVTAVSLSGLRQESLALTVLLGMSVVVAVGSAQMLFDVFFPDFGLKVEFGGSSKGGGGIGKLNTAIVGSMVIVVALFFIMAFSTTPLPGRWFPGVSIETITLATRIAVVVIGIATAAAAAVFGVRRMRRILTDM